MLIAKTEAILSSYANVRHNKQLNVLAIILVDDSKRFSRYNKKIVADD